MARTLSKIPSDLLERVTHKNTIEKFVIVWIAMKANIAGVVELSLPRLVVELGIRKGRIREAVESLAKKDIIIKSDNYNSDYGGLIFWSEKAAWSLYFGRCSKAQWESVQRSWQLSQSLFSACDLSQVLEQQYQILPVYNDNVQYTNTNTRNKRTTKKPSDLSPLGGRKSSAETDEEREIKFREDQAMLRYEEAVRNGTAGRPPE